MTTLASSARLLKDEALNAIAEDYNVAQFASYAPGPTLTPRFARIRGVHSALDAEPDVLAALLIERSTSRSVNVRTFRPTEPKGNPFVYGVTDPRDLVQRIESFAASGFFVIVNETIDIDDGGVSGVRGSGITEFAPRATPRAVEEPGICSVDNALANGILGTVYGFAPPFPADPELRIEFSIHPSGVGYRHERWIVWEVARAGREVLQPHLYWPNRFSRHIGDKAFGLLVAHLVGLAVPHTHVLARDVAPFSFGIDTGADDQWIRTCPREFSPGKFPTVHGWTDPFEMMATADPTGEHIASVLVQQGVEAAWSGAGRVTDGLPEIEGVCGRGDDFMLGLEPPAPLPTNVVEAVGRLLGDAHRRFGSVRAEWVADERHPWLVQLNATRRSNDVDISPGRATEWRQFDPSTGLDALQELIDDAQRDGAGIEVTRRVGLTSHIGDVLRASNVPARFAQTDDDN